ncbi:MAG: hypothetical protein LUF85_08425 [Bacteroides sp.]|nr:hypothetical protein [Bacteroides sp.]
MRNLHATFPGQKAYEREYSYRKRSFTMCDPALKCIVTTSGVSPKQLSHPIV